MSYNYKTSTKKYILKKLTPGGAALVNMVDEFFVHGQFTSKSFAFIVLTPNSANFIFINSNIFVFNYPTYSLYLALKN